MEDKAKIGELVKKLASETKLKLEFQKKLDEEKRQMEQRIKDMEEQNRAFQAERESMASKFEQSLKMLQDLKKSHI